MALALSPLAQVCKGIRAYLDSELNKDPDSSQVSVVLATPAETAGLDAGNAAHRLNLFFHRFEPAGLFPDALPGEPGWLRAFCLVTPFAGDEDGIGAGENDLRLVGEVVRVFHDKPVFRLDVDGEAYHVQVVFLPLSPDQMNQLWSTQGETIYRPSLLYEVSLAPVLPSQAAVPAPLAGAFGVDVRASLAGAGPGRPGRAPEVPAMAPAGDRPDWAPAIAFVHDGACAFSLAFALGSPELAAFAPQVWLAGQPGAPVTLRWQTWDAGHGWQTGPGTAAVVADAAIDPEAAAGAATVALALPFSDHVGQMLLHAERSYVRAADGSVLGVRSNPLLISLYAA